jgi:hypothetical protein
MVQRGWGPPPVGTAHGAVVRGRNGDDLPHSAELQFSPASAPLQSKELSGRSRPAAVKMPESPPFLGIPILLEVGSFIGVRGPLAATIACC